MDQMNEKILEAWLRLSTVISNERLVSKMPYNEALICGILYYNEKIQTKEKMTATELCARVRMLKSQMNRTLNSMEEKGLVIRERSAEDKRQVYVTLNMDKVEIYEQQHREILEFVGTLMDRIGKDKAVEIVRLFHLIADTADEVMK